MTVFRQEYGLLQGATPSFMTCRGRTQQPDLTSPGTSTLSATRHGAGSRRAMPDPAARLTIQGGAVSAHGRPAFLGYTRRVPVVRAGSPRLGTHKQMAAAQLAERGGANRRWLSPRRAIIEVEV